MSKRMRLLIGTSLVLAVASQAMPAHAHTRAVDIGACTTFYVTFSEPIHHKQAPSTFGPYDRVQINDGLPNHFRLTVYGIVGSAQTPIGAVHLTGSTSPQGAGDVEWVADSNYWKTMTIECEEPATQSAEK